VTRRGLRGRREHGLGERVGELETGRHDYFVDRTARDVFAVR
jgi:hypothetical protein